MENVQESKRATILQLRKPTPTNGNGGNGSTTEATVPKRVLIPIDKLKPNPEQVRQTWDASKDENGKTAIQRLAESIHQQGLISDLVVTPQADGFMILCGERRYRALQQLAWKEVPCVVRENLTSAQMLELNIVENLHREDLTPLDEAHAYQALMEKCGYTQAALAKRLGISGAMISYKLSLLNLTPGLQKQVAQGRLSETDGRRISTAASRVQNAEQQQQAMQTIEREIAKEPANPKTGKVESSAVKRVAETAVTQVAGAAALPQTRAPRAVAPAPAPAPATDKKAGAKVSAAVKEQAEHLIAVLKDVGEILRPSRRALGDRTFRLQVIRQVLTLQPLLPAKIQAAISPLDAIHKEAIEIINEKAAAKNQSAKPKTSGKAQAKQPKAKAAKKSGKK